MRSLRVAFTALVALGSSALLSGVAQAGSWDQGSSGQGVCMYNATWGAYPYSARNLSCTAPLSSALYAVDELDIYQRADMYVQAGGNSWNGVSTSAEVLSPSATLSYITSHHYWNAAVVSCRPGAAVWGRTHLYYGGWTNFTSGGHLECA